MVNVNDFRLNQSRISPEELAKYDGQYVAWSSDGTHIVAADPDPIHLDSLVRAAGYDPAETLVSRLAFPEDVSWSGWSLPDKSARP